MVVLAYGEFPYTNYSVYRKSIQCWSVDRVGVFVYKDWSVHFGGLFLSLLNMAGLRLQLRPDLFLSLVFNKDASL